MRAWGRGARWGFRPPPPCSPGRRRRRRRRGQHLMGPRARRPTESATTATGSGCLWCAPADSEDTKPRDERRPPAHRDHTWRGQHFALRSPGQPEVRWVPDERARVFRFVDRIMLSLALSDERPHARAGASQAHRPPELLTLSASVRGSNMSRAVGAFVERIGTSGLADPTLCTSRPRNAALWYRFLGR